MTLPALRGAGPAARSDTRCIGRDGNSSSSNIPASRITWPYNYTPPRPSEDGRVLETQSGVRIGGALRRPETAPPFGVMPLARARTDRAANAPRFADPPPGEPGASA